MDVQQSQNRGGSRPLQEDVCEASQRRQPQVVRHSPYHRIAGMTERSCEKGCARFYVALSF